MGTAHPCLFRCNFYPIVAVALLGLLWLAIHAGLLANKCRAPVEASFNHSCSTIHENYAEVGTIIVVSCTSIRPESISFSSSGKSASTFSRVSMNSILIGR